MKISKLEEHKLIFNNNSYITKFAVKPLALAMGSVKYDTYTHYSYYALATNYPDFYVRSELFAYDFELPLQFGKTKDGLYFEHNRQILYIPCFSEQNLKENEDAYDNTIKIIYNDGKGNETIVLENVECKIINDNY